LDNEITIEGKTNLTFSEDVGKRFQAYHWHVQNVDGYDLPGIASALKKAKTQTERPSLIIARTHIGYGSPNKQDTASAHGEPLGPDETKLVRQGLLWPYEPFHVPETAREHFEKARDFGSREEKQWATLFGAYEKAYPELARQWTDFHRKRWPENWQNALPFFAADHAPIATRAASGKVLEAIAPKLANLLGGSADLAPSTKTFIKSLGVFKTDHGGKNIHFGIREHAMGGILNGMALSGALVPYGATFLVFSDYMRPSIRLAALMKQQVIYVFTHDSVAVGEDGPTHQPIEHMAALRVIPNLTVVRPADANETAAAWKLALERRQGPTAIILTRQKLAVIDRSRYASADGLLRGAYVLADAGKGTPQILILATGSEVHIALAAYEKLVNEGIAARLVSMPSWEIFEAQDQGYRDEVLPPSVNARVAVEAGVSYGWQRYVGMNGKMVTIDHFGASAPGGLVLQQFGFTADAVVAAAKKALEA
jgi:transketolase